jgi:hypothetical protein
MGTFAYFTLFVNTGERSIRFNIIYNGARWCKKIVLKCLHLWKENNELKRAVMKAACIKTPI